MRRGEAEGQPYHFVARDRFEELIKEGFFIEWADTAERENIEEQPVKIAAYPNPAFGQSAVNYELPVDGIVKIELRDESGHLIKVLLNQDQAAGQHSLNVDLSDLKTGVYYYSISTKSGVVSTKFIKS